MTFYLPTHQNAISGYATREGSALQKDFAAGQFTTETGISVSGTTFATGRPLTAVINFCSTVAASSIAILPPAIPGQMCIIFNSGANTLTLEGKLTSDTIDGAASATLSTANRVVMLLCSDVGKWVSALLGATTS